MHKLILRMGPMHGAGRNAIFTVSFFNSPTGILANKFHIGAYHSGTAKIVCCLQNI